MPIGVRFGGSEGTKSALAGGGGVAQPPEPNYNTINSRKQLAEQGAELDRENVEFRYTAKQKAEQAKLRDAMDELDRSEDFSDDEKPEFRKQLMGKYLGIKRLPHEKEEMDFEKNIFTDFDEKTKKGSGRRYYIPPKGGRPFEIGEEKEGPITPQMQYKMREDSRKEATNLDTGKVDPIKEEEYYQRRVRGMTGGVGTTGMQQQGGGNTQQTGATGIGATGTQEPQPNDIGLSASLGEDPQPVAGVMDTIKTEEPETAKQSSEMKALGLPEGFGFDKDREWEYKNKTTGKTIYKDGYDKLPEKEKEKYEEVKKPEPKDNVLADAYELAKHLEKGYKATDEKNKEKGGWEYPFTVGGFSQKLDYNENKAKEEYIKLGRYIGEYEWSLQKNNIAGRVKYKKLLDEMVKGYGGNSNSMVAKAKK